MVVGTIRDRAWSAKATRRMQGKLMWLLILIIFNGPMDIKRMEIIETHYLERSCTNKLKEAEKMGLPSNTNLGCIYLSSVSKAS